MAVSIKELIENKEKIQETKKQTYDLETSIGKITVKKPSRALVAETLDLTDSQDGTGDKYLIFNSVIAPSLNDNELQKAYECLEPTDIVDKLFDTGEAAEIAKAIMKCAGYGKDIKKEIHQAAKN